VESTDVNAITSRQNPVVQRCRELARHRPARSDEVLLDGVHLVSEALAAGLAVTEVLMSGRLLEIEEGAALARRLERAGASLFRASEAAMEAASPVRTPTGIVAIGRVATEAGRTVWAPAPALVVCVAGVQDPGNVGAILRAAEAAGATGAVLTDGSADPLGWKALRGSMGSALRLPLRASGTVEEACEEARRAGVRAVASTPAGGQDLYEVDFRLPTMVLVGAEGAGLPAQVASAADVRVRIPMHEAVESLNAAVAAGIVLFEALRQRRNPECP